MKNIITLLSLFFLQGLLAQGPPVPFDDDGIILPIDQYDILLIISLIGVVIWFYRRRFISKRYF